MTATLTQVYTPNAAGYVDYYGQRPSDGRWYMEQTRPVSAGTESRRTKYFRTEVELQAAREAGQLGWSAWR